MLFQSVACVVSRSRGRERERKAGLVPVSLRLRCAVWEPGSRHARHLLVFSTRASALGTTRSFSSEARRFACLMTAQSREPHGAGGKSETSAEAIGPG